MSKRKRTAPCYRCGAPLNLSNCNPPTNPCPDCGRCECLRRNTVDYQPELD